MASVAAVPATAFPNDLPSDRLRVRPGASGTVSIDPLRAEWRYLSFETVRVSAAGVQVQIRQDHELALIVVSGRDVRVTADDRTIATLEGRDDPFSGLPWAVWLPNATRLALSSPGEAIVAVASAPRSARPGVSATERLITPADVVVEVRGTGRATRQVTHLIAPTFPADRLLVVEVLTPAGNWSSWPPHKHDVDDDPQEAVLEEVYLYGFRRSEAWGLQRLYRPRGGSAAGADRDAAWAVQSGELVLVTDGYHPFAASPRDDAYYLNALAGDRRTMACSYDPAITGAPATDDGVPDPRVPLSPVTPPALVSSTNPPSTAAHRRSPG